jgi:hypothetical protein
MSLAEVAGRTRHELTRRVDRLAEGHGRRPRVSVNEAALSEFRERVASDFSPGIADGASARWLRQHMPAAAAAALEVAEPLLAGRFDLLGYRDLYFGEPIDWHLDPVARRRSPRVHWSRLDPLATEVVGDSKVVWELNRHQWLIQLGVAYALTRDERYPRLFAVNIENWLSANPPGVGINWASSLELALRIVSWTWALALFADAEALTPGLFRQILESIAAQARHIERYLSRYFSPNTHLTGEALGLVYAGVMFPQLARADRWLELGTRVLLEEIAHQVLPDGVYFEQSTWYQRYTVDFYLHFLVLAQRRGLAVPASVGEAVTRMVDFLLHIRRPDGTVPLIGDADGGRLLPLARRTPEDFRDVFATAAATFRRSDYAWAAGELAPETIWLLGPRGPEAFQALVPRPPSTAPSRDFPHGGYVVMRSGWDAEAHHLILDAGPLGSPGSAGHGHADMLSVQCAAFGEPYLADAGTGTYAESEWRSFFRGSHSHSTVVVDGHDQAAPTAPFKWAEQPRARLCAWQRAGEIEVAQAEHLAYARLADPVVVRRSVLFVQGRYWIIVDDLRGDAEHRVETRFQFAPRRVELGSDLWVRAHGRRGRGMLMRAFADGALKAEVREAEVSPPSGWFSGDYGRRESAPVVIFSTVTRLPLRIVTLLVPVEDVVARPPAVALCREGDQICGLRIEGMTASLRIEAAPPAHHGE